MGHFNSVKKLLGHRADPFIKSYSQKLPLDVAKNNTIHSILSKAMLFHVELKKFTKDQQEIEWSR